MNIEEILSEIDAEIARLQQAKALLGNTASGSSTVVKRKPGRPPASSKTGVAPIAKTSGKKRTMSPEGRARIAAAQKVRWAKSKKAIKKAAAKKPGRPAKASGKKVSSKKTAAVKAETANAQ